METTTQMINAKKKWMLDYQKERERKREYIRQNVIAQGLDNNTLMAKLQKLKKTEIPCLDEVTMAELENLVEELRYEATGSKQAQEEEKKQDDEEEESAMMLYDELQTKEDKELDDSVSNVSSTNSFKSIGTKKVKPTVFNKKAYAQIYVADVFQLTSKIGKVVKGQSLMIVIQTYPMGWKVQRLDIDFMQLRKYLVKKYPQIIVPPLPLVKERKVLSRKQLHKKKIYYQKFLNIVLKSKLLRSCKLLVDFMQNTDQYRFGYNLQVKQSLSGPKNVQDIKTLSGQVLAEASGSAKDFSLNFQEFNSQYVQCNKKIALRCKAVEKASKTLANEYFALCSELKHLGQLVSGQSEIPQFQSLYQKASDLMHQMGDLSLHQGFLVNDSLNSQFKYQREQGKTSFKEAYALVKNLEQRHFKAQKSLDYEKYKIFQQKRKEIKKGKVSLDSGIEDDKILAKVVSIAKNFDQAKQFILPDRDQDIDALKNESEYFKQQLFNEVRRNVMLDYMSSREQFMDVGEQYTGHMQTVVNEWNKFIQYYHDANNQRKSADEEYV